MSLPCPRILASYHGQPPVELYRGHPTEKIKEGHRLHLTGELGPEWDHWIEKPIPDHEAIGRVVSLAPSTREFQLLAELNDAPTQDAD